MKIEGAKRSFNTYIVWDSKKIFEGIISFSLGRELESKISLGISVQSQYKKGF
jgi:hypothetical protein